MYKDKIIELKSKGYPYRKIKEVLGCSISTISYHCKKAGIKAYNNELSKDLQESIKYYYKTHTKKETALKFKISETTVVKYSESKRLRLSEKEKKKRRRKSVLDRRKLVKRKLVDYKGGKCIKCGYDKYLGALEFHHRDPKEKEFSISSRGKTIGIDKLKKEVDKCDLVCANCHREIHGKVA